MKIRLSENNKPVRSEIPRFCVIFTSTKHNKSDSRILKKYVSLLLQLVLIRLHYLDLTLVIHHLPTYLAKSENTLPVATDFDSSWLDSSID